MTEMNAAREQALEVNREQKKFYDKKVEQKRRLNPVMKLREVWRDRVYRVWEGIEVLDEVLKLLRDWVGDLRGKHALGLECFLENQVSLELALKSACYLGVDLSLSRKS